MRDDLPTNVYSVTVFFGSDRDDLWQMHRDHLDNSIASLVINKNVDEKQLNRIRKSVREFYFKDEGFSKANINNVTDVSRKKV